ncbi:M28 family peptidase [Undibacterium sp. LX15W]|uniref:M28 family peptidase n=2 Tax=Undibacterium flavidum TaxID=2762297 RepID=A0ABR6YF38_9BURK|nr:M28 family peptidase [Undibacterium flavidum]
MRLKTLYITITTIVLLAALVISIVTQPFVTPIPSTPEEIDLIKLKAHVKYLSTDVHPRSSSSFSNLEKAGQYVFDELKAMGAPVEVQEVKVKGKTYKNFIARFGPSTGPLLVIGAHYDSDAQSLRNWKPKGMATPGADDNASGVAGLLELARLLSKKQQSRSIELVAYTLEEDPHFGTEEMGSFRHARSLKESGHEVQLMLSIEMIGYFADKANSQDYPAPGMSALYGDRGNFITLVGNLSNFGAIRRAKALMRGVSNLPVVSCNAPANLQGIALSDHLNFWNEGYPALMVSDTAFFRNPHYHRMTDTFEKLDYRRMAQVVQGIYAITQHFS